MVPIDGGGGSGGGCAVLVMILAPIGGFILGSALGGEVLGVICALLAFLAFLAMNTDPVDG